MHISLRVRWALISGAAVISLAGSPSMKAHEPSAARARSSVDAATAASIESPVRVEPGARSFGGHTEFSDETRAIKGDLSSGPEKFWLGDVLVGDPNFDEVEPAICKAPDGTLFIAVEQHGDWDGWVAIYRSTDGGRTWARLIGYRTGTEARNPSITYTKRASGEKWIYLAYAATLSDSTKSIVVIRLDPETGQWHAATAAEGITGTPQIHPRICTDNLIYDVYYVYVTYSVYGIDNYMVMFTRSLDYGLTYTTPQNITGGSESSSFVALPDIAYGTAGLLVAFEKPGWTGSTWATQTWVTRSTNFGSSWAMPIQLTTAEDGAWHPSVAAAVGTPTVMVAYTQSFASQTDIYCAYSTNGGTSFSSSTPLPRTFDNEKSVALSVSDSGARYHAAYWRNYDIQYTYTDASSPLPWSPPITVNEANWASSTYSRPAICVNPTKPLSQEGCVTWTDYRGAIYDIYFDAGFLDGACCLPDESCIETNETGCLDVGGDWQGSGVPCEPDLCLIDPCETDVLAPTAHLELGDFQCVPHGEPSAIVGTANDPEDNLDGWELQERGASADPWAVVASGSVPIAGGVLANWSPAAPGYRMLRLIAADKCGHASSDVRLLYADQGPKAMLNYPTDGAIVGGSAVCVDGLVSHGVCALEWLLEYRPASGSWGHLAHGVGGVYNVPLTHWNTTLLADGKYEVRVSASSIGGVDAHAVGVTVDNTAPIATIVEPINCAWVDGQVEIHGTAADANMGRWDLQWTGGPSDTWNPIASGTASASGLLGRWDVSGLPHCAYTIRLVVHDESRIDCTNDAHWAEFLVSINVGGMSDMFDVDHDGDVDLHDYCFFADMFVGPN